MDKIVHCRTCGAEMAASAKSCPACGAKNKPPIYARVWFWLLIIFVVLPTVGTIVGTINSVNSNDTSNEATSSDSNNVVSNKVSTFEGDCGIAATAEMGSSIIGYPTLSISITNTTEKDIAAIQFYAIPYDV